ncbi:hypothetical protein CA13_44920 [Planctomycetes bacterium CA13]|uniref:Glycoside hydrolase family 5 domain-containing protein n=1 Tax=Novipirellula herctigrandis TaxID=2527986 RepID=A0A5C5Z6I0_9BACT|nr:hypothetical protein CA13_44920 [Planctomycetes bacterium CA13]
MKTHSFYSAMIVCAIAVSQASAETPKWAVVVSPAGSVQLKLNGNEAGSILPGLHEVAWEPATFKEGNWGQTVDDGIHRGTIATKSGTIVDVELRLDAENPTARFAYRLTPRSDIKLNSFFVSLTLPSGDWAGGTFEADDHLGKLPAEYDKMALRSGPIKSLQLKSPDGDSLALNVSQGTSVLLQDDRQWGQTFSIRVGPRLAQGEDWPAGETLSINFALSSKDGLGVEEDGPITVVPGKDWLPLDVTLDVEPGSAIDFSTVIPRHMPAGKYGRVIANSEGKFAFADQPNEPVRFYGVNLCFSAHYLSHELADKLAERLWRLGYNAIRIHHYERELIQRSSRDGLSFDLEKLDQLDYLFAALKKRGMYVTTDLFVSRPVSKSTIYPSENGINEQGNVGMDEYKMAVHVNDRAFENFKAFSRTLLDHVNPYTQLRYADDPTLSWLSLVNEDNPGNFIGKLEGVQKSDWQTAWNHWLSDRYGDRKSLVAALGDLPEDHSPAKGNVPLQNVYADTSASVIFNVFLAEIEQDFFNRTKQFLRKELGCQALLTDMNSWTNPMQMQAVRDSFDYVDDHFYVDHPKFLERSWSLPSSCPNTSPIAEGASGGRRCAFTRLYGKPFTITEFNYSSPGRFRGVGGILTGTLGALQDWDGLWRFAYAHNRENVAKPGPLNYFDVSADPLNQAAERASLCLFLRGDIEPAHHAVAITATREQLLDSPTSSRDKTPSWDGLAWLARVGWKVTGQTNSNSEQVVLPIEGGKIDPFGSDAGNRIFQGMKQIGWLDVSNSTELDKNRFQSDNGQVTIDAPEDMLTLDTPRTAGGFAPAGKQINTKAATIAIQDTGATVWISSLDTKPIRQSKRLLITHLTDLQNTDARYADKGRKILLDWGHLPHLVQTGRAMVSLRIDDPSHAKVYGLAASGKRISEIKTTIEAGQLVVPLSVSDNGKARMLYEVQIGAPAI